LRNLLRKRLGGRSGDSWTPPNRVPCPRFLYHDQESRDTANSLMTDPVLVRLRYSHRLNRACQGARPLRTKTASPALGIGREDKGHPFLARTATGSPGSGEARCCRCRSRPPWRWCYSPVSPLPRSLSTSAIAG